MAEAAEAAGTVQQAAARLAGMGRLDAVALTEAEKAISSNVADEVARGELAMRQEMAKAVGTIFLRTNMIVLGFIAAVILIDVVLLCAGVYQARDRVIDRGVIKTLIGATAVQVGVIMVTIARYLFPRPGKGWFG